MSSYNVRQFDCSVKGSVYYSVTFNFFKSDLCFKKANFVNKWIDKTPKLIIIQQTACSYSVRRKIN